ncbi:MAG: DUF5131 family protein [Firmicutes bacterium]|nr:DUF5131 family protein [Bacillota bacterium]
MNKTNIEWCDMTWNPVTGCYHGCEYCYARRIAHRFTKEEDYRFFKSEFRDGPTKVHEIVWPAERNKRKIPYPFEFEPTLHRCRLYEPIQRKKPAKIFVSSMGDLFGDWVPDEWIEEVLKACRKAPQHTYMFLTKNPWGYHRLQTLYSPNDWLGVTIDGTGTGNSFRDYKSKRKAMDYVAPVVNRFISIEPLIKPIDPEIIEGMDWVIVGAQTGPGAVAPKREWVQKIIDQCRTAGVPIFLKSNLNWPEKIQEWPG